MDRWTSIRSSMAAFALIGTLSGCGRQPEPAAFPTIPPTATPIPIECEPSQRPPIKPIEFFDPRAEHVLFPFDATVVAEDIVRGNREVDFYQVDAGKVNRLRLRRNGTEGVHGELSESTIDVFPQWVQDQVEADGHMPRVVMIVRTLHEGEGEDGVRSDSFRRQVVATRPGTIPFTSRESNSPIDVSRSVLAQVVKAEMLLAEQATKDPNGLDAPIPGC